MNVAWAVTGGVIGLAAGAAARGAVFQLSVPAGMPDRMACPCCAAPVGRWPAAWCAHCGASIGTPGALELATAGVLALVLGRFGGQPEAAAFAFLGVLGVALSAIDIAVQRLPDRLVLPAFPILGALLVASAVLQRDAAALAGALLGCLALTAAYLLLALLRPGQLGGGDIKLAGLVGLALGWLGWPALAAGTGAAFLLSAAASLALLATRRVTLRGSICFGPFLLGGALLAALWIGQPPV